MRSRSLTVLGLALSAVTFAGPAAASGYHYKSEEFDPHFMVIELVPGTRRGGMVEYLSAFDEGEFDVVQSFP